jgi:AbrB family looped-hinge helix DNA binding protein
MRSPRREGRRRPSGIRFTPVSISRAARGSSGKPPGGSRVERRLTVQVRRAGLTSGMGRRTCVVRLSSKGQIVIPVELRRELGLRAGQVLAVTRGPAGGLLFRPAEKAGADLEAELDGARAWFADWRRRTGRDPLEEFQARRSEERRREDAKRGRGRP